MSQPAISIVIPAFDEAARLPSTMDRLFQGLDAAVGPSWEVVVSDDGSTDATPDLVEGRIATEPRVRLVRSTSNRGKGAASARGTAAAAHPIVVLLDADLPVPLSTIPLLVAAMADLDLLVGSRRLPGSTFTTAQPLVRRIGGRGFLAAVRLLGYRAGSDPQCGVKVFDRDRMRPVLDQITTCGFAFDIELIERARRHGLRLGEAPVEWNHVPGSSVRPVRDALVTLRDLARLRRRLTGAPAPGRPPTTTLQG